MMRFAWRLLRREWHGGGLALVGLAVVVGVAAVTSVALLGDRVGRALDARASALLGADLVLESDRPIPMRFIEGVREAGLRHGRALHFPTMVLASPGGRLAWVVAVDDGYPLRGRVSVAAGPEQAFRDLRHPPGQGEVWLEPGLFYGLGVAVGETVQLGQARFVVAGLVRLQPLGGVVASGLAPRLLMRLGDLPGTGLVTPASRVNHRLLVAGERNAVARLRAAWQETLEPGMRLLDPRHAAPELSAALSRGERFLALAALCAVLLGGLAMALAARHFAEGHALHAALLRCFGASRAQVERVFLLQLLGLAVLAAGVGLVVGWGAQAGLVAALAPLLGLDLPVAGVWPWGLGLGAGVVGVLVFAWPPLRALGRVPVMVVLRRLHGPAAGRGHWLLAVSGSVALAWALMGDWGPGALVGIVGLALLFAMVVRVVMAVLGRLPVRGAGRVALAGLARRPAATVVQVSGVALALLALLVLTWMREELLVQWSRALPEDAPNHFFINITPDQREGFREALAELGGGAMELHPMIRGRPVAVNGRPIEVGENDGRAARLRRREANLTYLDHLPEDNRLVAGRWSPEQVGWSLEVDFARVLGVGVGDRLSFDIGGERVTAPVTSLREVAWEELRPNFFVIASPTLLKDRPATWMGAVRLPPGAVSQLPGLLSRYPNVTVIDVEGLIGQVRGVMDRVGLAVQLVFTFTLAAALVVMVAAWQFERGRLRREQALLRVMGARAGELARGRWWMAGVLGGMAGSLAAVGGAALSWWVGGVLGVEEASLWAGWGWGGLLGALLVAGVGGWLAWRDAGRLPWRDLYEE